MLGEGIDAADADAVETAGYLVGALVELSSGVEDGHDDLEGALVLFLVHVHGDASSVVLHGDAPVLVDGDFDVGAVAGEGLVDGVVHGLIDEVVQTLLGDVADVHGRTLSHGLESFEDLDVTRAVVRAVLDFFFHFLII